MRHYYLIAILILFSCNSNQQKIRPKVVEISNDKCYVYPSIIDSLHMQDLYDSACWYVYTWHCDERYLSKRDTTESISFGELPLKFNNFAFRGDTLEMNFDFIDQHEHRPILPSMTRNNIQFLSGVGFDMKTRKKIYMLSPNGFTTIVKGASSRYENPLQPEVLSYIKNNWNKLDSCFKKLVEQKGVKIKSYFLNWREQLSFKFVQLARVFLQGTRAFLYAPGL